jgi:hypothetical protein
VRFLLRSALALIIGTASPIQPGNQPTPVSGQQNGQMEASALITVEGSCRESRAAAPSLARLFAAARGDGVNLGPEDCYRPIDDQAVARNNACSSGNCPCAGPPGHSMHGWGKAIDFFYNGASITVPTNPGYKWLKANAARYGWNHPGWAEPGGSACPEMWHWEWVGDGGTMGGDPIRADVVGVAPSPSGNGYRTTTGLGAVAVHGDAVDAGSAANDALANLVVGSASTPDGKGYWLVASDGGVFSYGSARYLGSMGGSHLNQPIVGMASTPDGQGYWLVAADGGIFSFGTARFLGSTGGIRLNAPVVGMAAAPDGNGYWLVARDGGIFAYGSAPFLGSTGGMRLNQPVVAMATSGAGGYWLCASDGGIFSYGSATFMGSSGGTRLNAPVVGMAARPKSDGYWLVAADGGIFNYGQAPFLGAG